MIKLKDILFEDSNKILVPRRLEKRKEDQKRIALQKIQQYIKNGSKGSLDLRNTPITSLPDNLEVEGNLYLNNTLITSLPDNLKVGRYLNLYNTPIISLPNNLEVGGYLNLRNTPITSLPDNLKVEDDLHLNNTPISKKYSEEEIKKMVPGVVGNIHL